MPERKTPRDLLTSRPRGSFCYPMNEYSDPPASVIVVLGAGVGGQTSRFRAEAAAAVCENNPGSLLLCSGGRTAGAAGISEARWMKEYVLSRPGNALPADAILLDEESLDTAASAGNVASMLRARDDGGSATVTLIAGQRNAARMAAYLRAYGYDVWPLSVRDALVDSPLLGNVPDSVDPPRTSSEKRWEIIFRLLRLIDPRGRIVATVMRRHRKQRV